MENELVDKLQDLGIKAVDFASMSAEKLFSFVQKQAPEILNDWVVWNGVKSGLFFTLGLVMIILFIKGITKSLNPVTYNNEVYSTIWNHWYYENEYMIFFHGVKFLIFFLIGPILFVENFYFLQIVFFPKIWILENIKTLF